MFFNTTALIGRTKLEARPYQQRILDRVLLSYAKTPKQGGPDGGRGLCSVQIESPCGSGKTSTALMIIKAMQEIHPGLEVGWSSMRRNLLAQAKNENQDKGINANIHWLSMFDKELPPQLRSTAKNKRMLVIDESQHDAASSSVHLHEQCRAHWILGMTATPYRSDYARLCFDTTITDAGIQALIRDGYLSPYHYYSIPHWDADTITDCYLSDPQKWGQSIFYFHRHEECDLAARKLSENGIKIAIVHGGGSKADLLKREQTLDSFREGKLDALINCLVLTEGFDSPALKTVFLRPSCKGTTIQMAGRAFRKHPSSTHKQVVQPKRGWNFMRLVLPDDQFNLVDDCVSDGKVMGWNWQSIKLNPRINEISCNMIKRLAKIDMKMPDFITKNRGRKSTRGWDKTNSNEGL